jgi:hypothetical protein
MASPYFIDFFLALLDGKHQLSTEEALRSVKWIQDYYEPFKYTQMASVTYCNPIQHYANYVMSPLSPRAHRMEPWTRILLRLLASRSAACQCRTLRYFTAWSGRPALEISLNSNAATLMNVYNVLTMQCSALFAIESQMKPRKVCKRAHEIAFQSVEA